MSPTQSLLNFLPEEIEDAITVIDSLINPIYELTVIRCECSYVLGLDACPTHRIRRVACPKCGALLDTDRLPI